MTFLWVRNEESKYVGAIFLCELLLLGAFGLAVYFLRSRRNQKKTGYLVMFLLFAFELGCHMSLWGGYSTDRTEYLAHNKEISAAAYRLKQGSDFFRAVSDRKGTDNDGALLGLPYVSIFSSTAYKEMSDFFRKLEGQATPVAYGRFHDTPLQNMLFSRRYWIGSSAGPGDWEEVEEDFGDGIRISRNPRSLPLGFFVEDVFFKAWEEASGTAAEVQNQFMEGLGFSTSLRREESEDDLDGTFLFMAKRDGYYQVLMKTRVPELKLKKNGEERMVYNVAEGALLDVGFCREGELVFVSDEEKKQKIQGETYYFSEDELDRLFEMLSAHPWKLSCWEDDLLEGSISCPKAGTLMTTIPFDPGWTVTVDGEKKQPEKRMGAFLGVSLSAGNHRVTMEFKPEGFVEGSVVSFASVFFLAVIVLSKGKRKIRER